MNKKPLAVFFPYRAVCWDIFESVWIAACADGRYDVKVVPLPWYSLDKSGNVADWSYVPHYEGAQFPDYVPIVGYQAFEFAQDIDIAFIDNLYDGHFADLFVIDKPYWTHEIKKHVHKLVVIPSLGFGVGDISQAIKNCAADVLIAENKELHGYYKSLGSGKEILMLGNPKFDKIFDTEHIRIPQEWSQLAQVRTTFFLNMSVSFLQAYPDVYVSKLSRIIEFFSDNRASYLLIWRPHPAAEPIIEKISSHLLTKYRELLQSAQAFGIVDATSSPYAAMQIADAYIGDGGSLLLRQFGLTGKPIYLVCAGDGVQIDIDTFLWHYQVVQSSRFGQLDEEWEINWEVNGLYKICGVLENRAGDIRFESSIPFERNIRNLYNNYFEYDGKLLFAPDNAEHWAEYDIASKTWVNFDRFERAYMPEKYGRGLNCAVQDENYLYFSPGTARIFARFDKKTRQFEVFDNFFDEFIEMFGLTEKIEGQLFNDTRQHVVIDNHLWLCSPVCNCLCEVDLKTMTCVFHTVGPKSLSYFFFDYDGEDFWLLRFGGGVNENMPDTLVRWNKKTAETKYYTDLAIDKYNSNISAPTFNYICCFRGNIWISPHNNKHIVKFDPRTETATPFLLGNEEEIAEKTKTLGLSLAHNMIIPSYNHDNCLGIYSIPDFAEANFDIERHKFTKYITVKFDEDLLAERESLIPGLWLEADTLYLKDFVRKVANGSISSRNSELIEYIKKEYALINVDGSCGKKIWQNIS